MAAEVARPDILIYTIREIRQYVRKNVPEVEGIEDLTLNVSDIRALKICLHLTKDD